MPSCKQEWLVHVLERIGLLTDRDGERRKPDRPAREPFGNRGQDGAVDAFESRRVDLEQLEGVDRDLVGDGALMAHLGEVTDAPQDPVGDPRGAACAPGDLAGALRIDGDPKHPGRPLDDRLDVVQGRSSRAGG